MQTPCTTEIYLQVACARMMTDYMEIARAGSVLSGDTLGWCVCIGWGGWLGEVVAARGAAAAPILRSAATTVLLYYSRDSCLPLA